MSDTTEAVKQHLDRLPKGWRLIEEHMRIVGENEELLALCPVQMKDCARFIGAAPELLRSLMEENETLRDLLREAGSFTTPSPVCGPRLRERIQEALGPPVCAEGGEG